MALKKGDAVVIVIHAGLMRSWEDSRMVAACEPGTGGIYLGRHPSKKLKGWHLVAVGALVAALGPGQFEHGGPTKTIQPREDAE